MGVSEVASPLAQFQTFHDEIRHCRRPPLRCSRLHDGWDRTCPSPSNAVASTPARDKDGTERAAGRMHEQKEEGLVAERSAISKAPFLRLLNRLLNLAKLPGRQVQFATIHLAQKAGNALNEIAEGGRYGAPHAGLVARRCA